ncbi:MAG: hypothetical protein JWQ35_1616 [Bacteriovoracaceae bacterium]|nr:hypothetical protein [Bacteriovoracaceae bacterium]
MKSLFVTLLLSFVFYSSYAVEKNQGILPIGDAPNKIAIAAKSVVLLILPDRPQTTDLSSLKKQTALKKKAKTKFENDFIEHQIKWCESDHRLSRCPISLEFITATGFMMQKRDLLYTNYHPFFEYVRNVLNVNPKVDEDSSLKNKLLGAKFPVFIYTNDGELIFNPSKGSATIKNLSLVAAFAESKSDISPTYDFLELKLSKELKNIEPLQPGTFIDKNPVYLIGYSISNEPSQNISLHFSSGKYLTYDEAASSLKLSKLNELSKESAKIATEATFYFSGPSESGMSGGPYLNKNGEVIGIHRGTRDTTGHEPLSIGIKIPFVLQFPYGLHDK